MPDETYLMQSIKNRWGSLIAEVCSRSSVPEAFIAALIANESGGDPDATRFEPTVFKRLQAKHPDWDGERVTDNATSWGLLQIMGENYPGPPKELADPSTNLHFGIVMLAKFAQRYQLDLTSEFRELFHCWNTGRPDAQTYDPFYADHGLKRMEIWASL